MLRHMTYLLNAVFQLIDNVNLNKPKHHFFHITEVKLKLATMFLKKTCLILSLISAQFSTFKFCLRLKFIWPFLLLFLPLFYISNLFEII